MRSKRFTFGPVVIHPERSESTTSAISSSPRVGRPKGRNSSRMPHQRTVRSPSFTAPVARSAAGTAFEVGVHDLAIIVVSTNEAHWIRPCLRTVLPRLEGMEADVVVVDNSSRDGVRQMVEEEFRGARV